MLERPKADLLLRRPEPNHSESLRGFALRLDSENCIHLFGPRLKSIKHTDVILIDMEALTGKSLEILGERVCKIHVDRGRTMSANVFGHRVPMAWITNRVKRICPKCLKNHGHMHGLWEVHIIKSCMIHECYLIHQCQMCSELLEWESGGLFHCKCGANLRVMQVSPVGPRRFDLDLLISESLYFTVAGRANLAQTQMFHLLFKSGSSRFAEFAVISGHVTPRIGYAIAIKDDSAKEEQQCEFALRLISLGRPGVDAALFAVLSNEMQGMTSKQRAILLRRCTRARQKAIQSGFNLNADLQALDFVRNVLLPAWDEAHRRWQSSVNESLANLEAEVTRKADALKAEAACKRQRSRVEKEAVRLNEIEGRRAEPQAIKDAKAAQKAAQRAKNDEWFFQFVLAVYQVDPVHAEYVYWRRWEWFLERLAKWRP